MNLLIQYYVLFKTIVNAIELKEGHYETIINLLNHLISCSQNGTYLADQYKGNRFVDIQYVC